jgi:PIN domain nuclease of toxin-antitoxin system
VSKVVLDASALLALLEEDADTERWAADVKDAAISAVNLSEVIAKLAEVGMQFPEIREALEPLMIQIIAFDTRQAYEAGLLRPQTKSLGLSLGDRACLALARHLKVPALTADRAWIKLQIGAEIRLIR